MNGWTLFFVIVGIGYCTAQLFRFVDWIERPPKHPRLDGEV